MSAQFVDALLGYEYYMRTRGQATMDEVNEHLIQNHRSPIQLRTYGHYKKLIAHGFRSYIPINKFDVFQSLGKLQMAADRRQYQRRPCEIPLRISKDLKTWVTGQAVDISPVGFGIEASERFPASPGKALWVQMDGYEVIPTILIWRKHGENNTRMGLRATEFIANFELIPILVSRERLTSRFSLFRHDDSSIDWQYFVGLLEKSTELIVAASELLYSIADATQSSLRLARPELESIQFASPGSAEVKIDFGIAEILKVVIDAFTSLGLSRNRYRLENEKLELENRTVELENRDKELDIQRKTLSIYKEFKESGITDEVISSLSHGPLRSLLNQSQLPSSLFEQSSVERGILEDRLLPAAAELIASDDPSVEVEVSTPEN